MDLNKCTEIAYNYLKDKKFKERETGYLFHHGQRVARLSQQLGKKLSLFEENKELYIAGLFHDIAKGNEPHNYNGALLTEQLLSHLPQKQLEKISSLVYYHNLRGEKGLCKDTLLLQDADILDHTGTLDVWLGMHWVVDNDYSPNQAVKFFLGGKWEEMVEQQRVKLNFSLSKKIYDRRVNYAYQFFKQMSEEMDGRL